MLINTLEKLFREAFTQTFPGKIAADFAVTITRSTQAHFGHYQCNSAMKLSKLLNLPPREIAAKIVTALQGNVALHQLEIAGPGFINISFSSAYLNQRCNELQQDLKKDCQVSPSQKIIVDFSSPNTAKEMHVGHLRSTIIGDCLAKVLAFQGHEVWRINHIGDWGTAFGMLIAYIKQHQPSLADPHQTASLAALVQAYKAAKALFDADPAFKKTAQAEVVNLQAGDPQSLVIWRLICEISRKAYQEIYDLLNIAIIERGESFYNPLLANLVQDLETKGVIRDSEGAKCIFLPGFTNREGEPLPFILQKSDGGYNYATTDMAALKYRIEEEKAERIIYVTDSGQAVHFAMLQAAGQKAGFLNPEKTRIDHVGFGLVLGNDGKKFKTRSGETEKLIDLLTTAVAKAEAILLSRGMDPQEIPTTAKVLGINAVKYADLSCNRQHDYVFSYDKMLRFEGNTAAFLLYAYVRIQSIKRKITSQQAAAIDCQHPSELALGLHLCQFAETLEVISQELMPNRLCDYLYELAEKFNAFFRDCRVEGDVQQNQRLALCELTGKILQQGLTLLGLEIVAKM